MAWNFPMKTFTLLLKLLKVLGTLWDNLDWYLNHLRSSLNYLCFTRSRLIYWTEFYYQKLNLFNFLPWYGMRKKLHWEYPRQYKVDWWRHELDHMTFFEYNFCYVLHTLRMYWRHLLSSFIKDFGLSIIL